MPTPADAAPNSDRRQSGSKTRSTSTSPSPNAVVSAAVAAMHANGGSNNHNRRNESVDSIIELSESDMQQLVDSLYQAQHRAEALYILSKVVNYRPGRTVELAPKLWAAPGVVFILLQEPMTAYYILNNEDRLKLIEGRVLNAICLLQCIAMHSSLRRPFVTAHIPAYLYPFMRIRESNPTIEKLRLASLGILGALVKMNSSEVTHYLLDSEAFPCCLCSLEFGNELAKTVAAFVVFKLLSTKLGIHYCCNVSERFLAVLQVLRKTVEQTSELNERAMRVIKFVLGSYLVLAEFPRAWEYLRLYFPSKFCNGHFLTQLGKAKPKLYEDLKTLRDKIDAEMIQLSLPKTDPLRP